MPKTLFFKIYFPAIHLVSLMKITKGPSDFVIGPGHAISNHVVSFYATTICVPRASPLNGQRTPPSRAR